MQACKPTVCVCLHLWMFYTCYVPTTLVVLSWVWPSLDIRAMPKSKILGFILASCRTLLALRSLWIIFNLESWWRYKIPRAIPMMISKRLLQSKNELLVWLAIKFWSSILKMWCWNMCSRYFKHILFCTYVIKAHKIWWP